MTKKPQRPLTARQSKFVELYLTEDSATSAAIKAGYSAKSAANTGCNLLNNPRVQAAIKAQQEELKIQTGALKVEKRRMLWEVAKEGRANLYTKEVSDTGELIDVYNAKNASAVVNSISELNRMDGDLAVIEQRMELTGGIQINHVDILNAARKRLEDSKKQ